MCMITRFEKLHPNLTVYHVIADKSTKALVDTTICTGLDEYKTVKKNFVTKIYAILYYKNDVSGYEGNANEWDEFHAKLDAGYAKAFLFEYGKMENGKFCEIEVLSNKHGLSFRNCIDPDVEDKENASYTDRMIVVKIKDELYRYIISDSCFRKLTDEEEQAYSEYLSTKTFYTLEETDKIYKIYEEEGVDDSLFKEINGAPDERSIIEDIHNLIKIKMDIKYEYVPSIKYRNVNECSSVISRLTASCEVGYDEADYRVPRR